MAKYCCVHMLCVGKGQELLKEAEANFKELGCEVKFLLRYVWYLQCFYNTWR